MHQIVDVAAGKGAVKRQGAVRTCSFCATQAADGVADPRVFICDRCVDLGDEVVVDGGQRSNERTLLVAVDVSDAKGRCSFCGKRRRDVAAMARAPLRHADVRICADCLRLCDEILAERQPAPGWTSPVS